MIPKTVPIVPNLKKTSFETKNFVCQSKILEKIFGKFFGEILAKFWQNSTSVFLERDAFIIHTTFPKSTNYFNHP